MDLSSQSPIIPLSHVDTTHYNEIVKLHDSVRSSIYNKFQGVQRFSAISAISDASSYSRLHVTCNIGF